MNSRQTTFPNRNHCGYGRRFNGQLDYQRSIPDQKHGDVTTFYIWTTVSCSTNTNFH